MGKRTDREGLREHMRHRANATRELADEMALMFGCDDPLHPLAVNEFRDWKDFVDRVARPLVAADGDREAEQTAMQLYRRASPYSICVSMVMMANRLAEEDR